MQTVDVDALGLAPGDRLLDVGCGEGRHMHAASRRGIETVGIDLDGDRLRRARAGLDAAVDRGAGADRPPGRGPDRGAEADGGDGTAPVGGVVRGDALSLPFPDGAFDAAICAEVLEHLPEYGPALDEIARVLRPGGRLGVSVPRYGPERLCWLLSDGYHEVEGGHVRIFRRRELREAIEARGLRCVDAGFAHALHSPYWWLKCLAWDRQEPPAPVTGYERFLEWQLLADSRLARLARRAERLLDPVIGKSLVLYFVKD